MKIVKEFILREIAGECVLVPTGATSQEFNGMITISDTARRDTIAFVGALVENGFIECTREDGTW